MIVVTGATGRLGGHVVDGLLGRVPADQVAVVVRDAEKAAPLAARGVEVRVGDYNVPDSLRDAFAAGDRVLLISSPEAGRRVSQHQAVVDAAQRADVALLAYTGVLGGPSADFELAAEHTSTEQAVLYARVPYVFLRNGRYSENYTENLRPVLASGTVVGSAGSGRIATAARADYAAAAVAVLTGEGHEGHAYELSGDTAWSFPEYAEMLTRLSGEAIRYLDVSPATHRAILTDTGVPEPYAAADVDIDHAISRGLLAGTSGELSRLIGRPTVPMEDSITKALARP